MSKILFCLPRYHTNVVPWVRILKAAGHEVVVHVSTSSPTENYSLLSPRIFSPCRWSMRMMAAANDSATAEMFRFPVPGDYWRVLADENPDVVIVRGVTRLFPRLVAACGFLQRRLVVVYDQEEVCPKAASTWLRRAALRALGIRHVTPLFARCEGRFGLRSAATLPFGYYRDPVALSIVEIGTACVPKILMVAKYRERKGHLMLLEALHLIAPVFPFEVTFCGEEKNHVDLEFCNMLLAKAAELGIRERVRILNNVDHDQMIYVYAKHDLFVLPSRQEPAAVSPIEAAWAGCYVIVSADSGTRGYLPPGQDHEFDSNKVSDLVRVLTRAIRSVDHLNEGKRRCKEYIESVAGDARILEVFQNLIDRKGVRKK